jgi:hypothetical protein
VVNEYPKSGGSWLSDMLADALGYKSVRNDPIRLERSVLNDHFLHPLMLDNVVVLWRDPRDVIVSFYHHCYFANEHRNAALVRLMKRRRPFADYSDVSGNLPKFIEDITTRPIAPKFSWPQFAANWIGRKGIVETRYEVLRHDTANELKRLVQAIAGSELADFRAYEIADNRSFAKAKAEAVAKAGKHVEMTFVREGSTGGWRKHFSPEAIAVLKRLDYERWMEKLGYDLSD